MSDCGENSAGERALLGGKQGLARRVAAAPKLALETSLWKLKFSRVRRVNCFVVMQTPMGWGPLNSEFAKD